MSTKTRADALKVIAMILAGAAIWTLLPLPSPKANDLGYVSACPFAPWSTLARWVVAGIVWSIRQYLVAQPKQ